MSETAAKKDIQKLQRAIVDGLEDVKAHDIRVFNTEHLSPLFERVMVASGNSNRQTKAIAASVRDKVREAGFSKPRIEGEENGEWIIIDCGSAVAHVMQPPIRQYYNLEEIWGEKPVHLKGPAVRASVRRAAAAQEAAEKSAAPTQPAAGKKAVAKKMTTKSAAAKPTPASSAPQIRTSGAKVTKAPAAAKKTVSRKAPVSKLVVESAALAKAPRKAAPRAVAKSPARLAAKPATAAGEPARKKPRA